MTPDQDMDRVERIARLLAQPDLRARRESREQLKKLKAMVERHRVEDELAQTSRARRESQDQLMKLKALVEKHRIEDEWLANLKKAQDPADQLGANDL